MGYKKSFNLVTLQLIIPLSTMTKAEYKNAYGIDLDDIDIERVTLLQDDGSKNKYFVDEIKTTENGVDIFAGGNILSIGSSVSVVENAYSVENATPLYWHGLQIYNNVTKTTLLYAHIINHSDIPFDSLSKLVSWFYSIEGLVYLQCTGFLVIEGVTYDVYSIYKTSTDLTPRLNAIVRKEGENVYSILNDINLSSIADTFTDATNKLN